MSLGIGETLRAARRRRGTSLADVAADTRVRESYLAAIEQEDFEGLGGDVYVKGFITSYARYLELDPEPLLEIYRTHAGDSDGLDRIAPTLPEEQPPLPNRRERPAGVAILLVLLLVVMVALVLFSLRGGDQALGGAALQVAGAALVIPAAVAGARSRSRSSERSPGTDLDGS